MIEFIAKYWLEVIFSLVCGGIAWTAKYLIKTLKEERKRQNTELLNNMDTNLKQHSVQMQSDMKECSNKLLEIVEKKNEELLKADAQIHKEIDGLRDGILSIQGRDFKEDCHILLQEGHIITANEYE